MSMGLRADWRFSLATNVDVARVKLGDGKIIQEVCGQDEKSNNIL